MAIVYPHPAYQSVTDISFPRPASENESGQGSGPIFSLRYNEYSSEQKDFRQSLAEISGRSTNELN